MPLSDSASFFRANPVFKRAEYASVIGCQPDDATVEAMLDRHIRVGDIKHAALDVFVSVPECIPRREPNKWPPDCFLVASRIRDDGVIAYHSALNLHGCAYALGCLLQILSWGPPGKLWAGGFVYEAMEPPRGLDLGASPPADGIETIKYREVDIRVTTLERTIVDLFGQPERGGDILIDSLNLVTKVDGAALVRHAKTLGSATAAGCLGWWLERRRDMFGRDDVDDGTIEELRPLAPRQVRYGLCAEPGSGRDRGMLAEGWNVIVPEKYADDPTLHWGF